MTGRVDSVLPMFQIYLFISLQNKYDTKLIIYMNQNNNNMNYIKVQSEEIIFSKSSDRHILIKKEYDEIIGLNYCQGDDLEYFVDNCMDIDHELTDFFIAIKNNFNGFEENELINRVIWAHFEFKNLRDARKAL